MARRFSMAVLALTLAASGCVSQAQFLNNMQPAALQNAEARGRFELNCPNATATMLSREVVPPVRDASSGSRKSVMRWDVALRLLAIGLALLVASVSLLSFSHAQMDQAPPPAAQVTPDPWPKLFTISGAKYTLYQPQVDKWDGYNFEGHAAVAVLPAGAKDPISGAIEITAVTDVAKVS